MVEKFRQLGIQQELLQAIEEHKFEIPSEIQEKAIPLALAGKDIIGGSATGSGKTLAFGASIIQNCVQGEGTQALILTPTRELAEQIAQSLDRFSKFKELNIVAVYGGVSINPQIDALRHADIVVGTPGRILDHTERRTIDYRKIKTLVIDEADRMFDMGFIDDVEQIISHVPKERQTMLFSATISSDIAHLTKKHMKNPVEIAVESYIDASKLTQVFYDVPSNMKFSALVYLLKKEKSKLVMVFCNTQRNTDLIARNLQKQEIDAAPIHGGMSQNKRNYVLDKFHKGTTTVLVCTDVAARGLDIKGVSHVYNYDSPKNSKEYIHRIGRTARAGKEGKAITILADRDYENFRSVTRDSELKIKEEKFEEEIPIISIEMNRGRFGSRGFGGGRREFANRGGFDRGRSHERRDFERPQRSFEERRDFASNGGFGGKNPILATPGFHSSGFRSREQDESGERRSYGRRSFGNREGRSEGRRSFGGRRDFRKKRFEKRF